MLETLAAQGRTSLKNYTALKFLPQAFRYVKTETGRKYKNSENFEFRQQINFPPNEKGHCFLCDHDFVVAHIRRHFQRQYVTKVAEEGRPFTLKSYVMLTLSPCPVEPL